MPNLHHCPACQRPRHGLTADQVFETLTQRLNSAKFALRVRPLRRLAHRIGTCDCSAHRATPPPIPGSLLATLIGEYCVREAA